MKEHKQIFLTMPCKSCSEEEDKWGRTFKTERKFTSHVNEPDRFVCGNCGRFVSLTEKEIEDAQLNVLEEVTKNDISRN